MLELAVKLLLAYLVGSVVGALVLGAVKGVDIRTLGSGNAGSTNALRTQGAGFALGVMLIDVGKGYLAARVIPGLPWPPPDPELDRAWLAVATSGATTASHTASVGIRCTGVRPSSVPKNVAAPLPPRNSCHTG